MVGGSLIGPEVPEHVEHRIRARDGRAIAVAEWGDPAGTPLIALHGTPGGRIAYWHDAGIYARHGLRRFTFDRPGYGESTRRRGRRVSDITRDLIDIADYFSLDRFAITGASGGGPHALACAALVPGRVLRCLADVSLAPVDAIGLDWTAGMNEGNVEEFGAARAGEEAIRRLADRERTTTLARISDGRADFLGDAYALSDADQEQMATHFWQFANQLQSCLASGVDGWVDDDLAFVAPWGFDVTSIDVPILLKYGRDDTLVPPSHGDWLASHLRGAKVVIEDSGHMGEDATYDDELAWLAGEP